ncbi:MAG: protein translocase subunit SecD [Planctomycetia bacterium]|nr:protein translocase subunit SecD [Planctomycetia bacterium]
MLFSGLAAFCMSMMLLGSISSLVAEEKGNNTPVPVKADTVKAETPKTEAPKAEAAKTAPKTEAAKTDAAKTAPKTETPKADAAEAKAPAAPAASEQVMAPSAPVPAKKNHQGAINFAAVIALLLVSIFLARFLAKVFVLPEKQNAYTIIIFLFVGSLLSTIFGIYGNRLNLGIDLRGGSILVYSVSPNIADNATEQERRDQEGKTITNQQMGELKSALARRINPSGVREISIQELGNNSEVKITIPEADDAEVARIERIINSSGQLKFRILASTTAPEEKELIELAQKMKDGWNVLLPKPGGKDSIILGGTWVPVDPTQMDSVRSPDLVLRKSLAEVRDPNAPVPTTDVLVLDLAPLYDVNGRHMATIRESVGSRGDPEVMFAMNTEGAERMQHLTSRYKAGADRERGRQLGIVMNDSLYSAPTINDTIGRSGVITFGRDLGADNRTRIQKEVRDLIQVMNAGVLPAKLSEEPVSSMVTGPTLGADTIEKGKNSILWAGALVLLFMIAYYGFGGMIASFAVIMNLLLIMACMLGLRAAFTLPGLAGLALTVGMAVDANILIFERIKEEVNNGATLRMAIRNGFQRAFSAIVDSNITTMLTAVILYAVGTEQIKGFAVTLFLGVGFSMFTATYVSRAIFETCEKMGFIGKRCVYPILPGLKPFGKTNINFMAGRKIALRIATIIIIVGIIAVFARGKGIFDIDFVGGVEVQTVFKQPQDISNIRAKLKELPDLSVSNLSLSKDRMGNPVKENTFFTICTSCPPNKVADQYRDEVEALLKKAFGSDLRHYTFSYKVTGTDQAPVKGSVDNKKENRVLAEVQINPPMSADVIQGYIEDQRDTILKGKGTGADDIEKIAVEVLAPAGKKIAKDAPNDQWNVAITTEDKALTENILKLVEKNVNEKQTFEASNTIGSSVAGYARTQGLIALLGSLICIILYIWVRFTKIVFGLSSVIALVYNVLIALGGIALSYWLAPYFGFLGISEFKIGLPTVAAFLTIIGYSLNDTIVLFDRIREVFGKGTRLTEEIVNRSINQTLSRTVLTSITTLFVAVVLYFFGGASIHTFAFTMCLGIVFGTLGTIFVASTYLLWLMQMEEKKKNAPAAPSIDKYDGKKNDKYEGKKAAKA